MEHLLGIDDLTYKDIEHYLKTAQSFSKALEKGDWDRQKLANKVILLMFYENSTRTLTSFDIAAKRLGANVVVWHPEISSVHKNESFGDTIDTLAAMKPDGVVIRHKEYGAPQFVATRVDCPVINGGDSWREHPTQALIDAYTMVKHKKTLEGLRVAICGDITHSRVARSNAILLQKMGADVRFIAPDFLLPQADKSKPDAFKNVEQFSSMEEGLKGCDVIMMLRIQKERMDKSLVPDDAAYFNQYGLTSERLKLAKSDVIVMHPGPMNRGVEIAEDVADDPRKSVILEQVANGIPVRMAVLNILCGNK